MGDLFPGAVPGAAQWRRIDTAHGRLATLEALPADGIRIRGTAVLVPGYSGSKEDFIPLLARIVADRYRAVCYDQRGQFESTGPRQARKYTVASFAEDLRTVVDTVSDDQPVHLLGHSFGGLVARHLVIAKPALARSLTLLDSGPGGASLSHARLVGLLVWLIRLGGTRALAAVTVRGVSRAGASQDQLLWIRHRLLHTKPANLIGILQATANEPDRIAELAATAVPVLVAFGENDDRWSPNTQLDMARRLKARAVAIQDAGHMPNEDQPEATADAVLDFWESVDARA